MSRYDREVVKLDFGDDDSGIYWETMMSVDHENQEIADYLILKVGVAGKLWNLSQIDEDLRNKILDRTNKVEYKEIF
jgi:hypothetical protein